MDFIVPPVKAEEEQDKFCGLHWTLCWHCSEAPEACI